MISKGWIEKFNYGGTGGSFWVVSRAEVRVKSTLFRALVFTYSGPGKYNVGADIWKFV